jgi:hypothetical protein
VVEGVVVVLLDGVVPELCVGPAAFEPQAARTIAAIDNATPTPAAPDILRFLSIKAF